MSREQMIHIAEKHYCSMHKLTYNIHEITPYINWIYFFHAWGFKPSSTASPEAKSLLAEAGTMLSEMEGNVIVQCIYRLCRANSDGDNLLLDNIVFPLLRQQTPHPDGSPYLCLSDFVRPLSSGVEDTVGVFASSVPQEMEACFLGDPYKHLLVQTLSDRLVEAATEKMHEYIRKTAWGYAQNESLSMSDLLAERFQGIRPAVGYPSLPDQSVNFLIDDLLGMESIGITLTENGAMHPHASVSGLMLAHPAARYFSVGRIGKDQLEDYARRRGLTVEKMKKFLAASITET